MLREHAPLIAVSAVVAILFYLVFRDLRGLHAELDGLNAAASMALTDEPRAAAQAAPSTAPPTTEQPVDTAPPAAKRRA